MQAYAPLDVNSWGGVAARFELEPELVPVSVSPETVNVEWSTVAVTSPDGVAHVSPLTMVAVSPETEYALGGHPWTVLDAIVT